MAKKASTINIEERVWGVIEDYMAKYDINRNKAIEWIVLEHESMLRNGVPVQEAKIEEPIASPKVIEESISIEEINDIFGSMSDE